MIVKGIDERKAASTILIFGIIQWILIVLLAEGIQPEYISSIHYVSSLRTGKTASIYNTSTILLGACVAIVSLLIRQFNSSRIFFVLFLIAGLATIGVGVFPEDSRLMHGIVTPVALIFGALAALLSYKI